MAKRFTDTDKWKKPFIRGLPAPYKLLWFYILDDCDMAGIWQVDFDVACLRIGEIVNEEEALRLFGDRIDTFGNKWFVKDFILFQYGELKNTNRMHGAVLATLQKNEINPEGASKALIRGQGQEQGKGQGKRQGQGQFVVLPKTEIYKSIFDDELFVTNLQSTYPDKDLKQAFEECYIHHSEKPSPPRETWEWRIKLNTWLTMSPAQRKKSNGYQKGKFVQ